MEERPRKKVRKGCCFVYSPRSNVVSRSYDAQKVSEEAAALGTFAIGFVLLCTSSPHPWPISQS